MISRVAHAMTPAYFPVLIVRRLLLLLLLRACHYSHSQIFIIIIIIIIYRPVPQTLITSRCISHKQKLPTQNPHIPPRQHIPTWNPLQSLHHALPRPEEEVLLDIRWRSGPEGEAAVHAQEGVEVGGRVGVERVGTGCEEGIGGDVGGAAAADYYYGEGRRGGGGGGRGEGVREAEEELLVIAAKEVADEN